MNHDYVRHNAPKPVKPQPVPGELLFELLVGHDRYLCELRDHGPDQGVEAQFWKGFAPWMGLMLSAREHAVQWAEEERKAIERQAIDG